MSERDEVSGDRTWALWLGLMLVGCALNMYEGETLRWFGGWMLGFSTAGLMFHRTER